MDYLPDSFIERYLSAKHQVPSIFTLGRHVWGAGKNFSQSKTSKRTDFVCLRQRDADRELGSSGTLDPAKGLTRDLWPLATNVGIGDAARGESHAQRYLDGLAGLFIYLTSLIRINF